MSDSDEEIKFQITILDGDEISTETVTGFRSCAPGLVVHEDSDGLWRVTHAITGLLACKTKWLSKDEALLFCEKVSHLKWSAVIKDLPEEELAVYRNAAAAAREEIAFAAMGGD